jgi:hypothetical protein
MNAKRAFVPRPWPLSRAGAGMSAGTMEALAVTADQRDLKPWKRGLTIYHQLTDSIAAELQNLRGNR